VYAALRTGNGVARICAKLRLPVSLCAAATAAIVVATMAAFGGSVVEQYHVAAVSNGGILSGSVWLVSGNPESERFAVTKDVDVCGGGDRVVDWVSVADGGLLDAVVYIEDIGSGKPFSPDFTTVVIRQEGCRYRPWLQVVMDAGTMEVRNLDSVMHNVHAYEIIHSARRSLFSVVQQAGDDAVRTIVRATRGNSVKIECDAHDFMHAWLFVVRNPYFAVVSRGGQYRISDIPAGRYRVKSWHGRLGFREALAEIHPGEESHIDFYY
jgi:hypothetical protein